jgi:Ca2+-binding RTX toxin-like protein
MRQLLSRLLRRRPVSALALQTPCPRRRAQPQLEALEDRRVPAVTLYANGGLWIEGSSADDYAYVSPVTENGINYLRVETYLGPTHQSNWFEAAKVTEIVFLGGQGHDRFQHGTALPCWQYGGDGNDSLIGGYGMDVLYGGGGNDFLYDSTVSNDWLFGEAGNDTLQAGDGSDRLIGGDGSDLLEGHVGDDWLWGEVGNDTLDGGWGNDVLYGGDGDDNLSGFQGRDWLLGEGGNDYLHDAEGTGDTLVGGAGSDAFRYDLGLDDVRDLDPSQGDRAA